MELADIKGFIKRYSESYLFLSGIKSLSWMYIFIGLIPLGYGIITRKFISTKNDFDFLLSKIFAFWQFIIVYIVVFSNATIFISGNCDVG